MAQELGQALLEAIRYEHESAQLLTGSLMAYALPRRYRPADPQRAKRGASQFASARHPPGRRGGTTPALGLVVNAIVDALSEYGVTHIEMPATPERVWRALQEAKTRYARPY